MIAKAQVIAALRPWLGGPLSAALEAQMEEITHWLNAWSPRQEQKALAEEIDSLLVRAVHEVTRGRMLLQLEDGSWVRIRLEEFAAMADDVLYPLLITLPVDAEHLLLLREFSMQHASLSALRVLYTRYAALHTPEELRAIASFTKKCYPPFRWREWLAADA